MCACMCACVSRHTHASVCLWRVRPALGLLLFYYLVESEYQTQLTRPLQTQAPLLVSHSATGTWNVFSKLVLLNERASKILNGVVFCFAKWSLIPYSYYTSGLVSDVSWVLPGVCGNQNKETNPAVHHESQQIQSLPVSDQVPWTEEWQDYCLCW